MMLAWCCATPLYHSLLQWHHDGLDGISNHQPHHSLLSHLFGRRSKKTSKLRVTGLCAGNSPGTGEFPAQRASNAENVSIGWRPVFYLKFFEHPSFGQVAHEIYPSEWKVHSSEISITIMYCWYMFLMAVATDFTHVTINLVCCCLSPILISHKRSCWKISQSLKPIWLDVEMLVPLFLKNQSVLQRCLSNFRAIGRLEEA